MDLPTPDDLRDQRGELGLTQSELAERADVSQPLIARIEGGDVDPRLSTLRRIVNALKEAEGDIVRARDLMNESVVSVDPDDPTRVAAERMDQEAFSQLPVLLNGTPVGSIRQGDIAKLDADGLDDPVREHMSESFPSVSPDATIDELRSLLNHKAAVIVTDRDETIGIITEADITARLL